MKEDPPGAANNEDWLPPASPPRPGASPCPPEVNGDMGSEQEQHQHQQQPVEQPRAPPVALAGGEGLPIDAVGGGGQGGVLTGAHSAGFVSMGLLGLGASGSKPNKRMPRDPVTNQRICFEYVRGACPRPPGSCRYAHVIPQHLAAVNQLAPSQPLAAPAGAAGGVGSLAAAERSSSRQHDVHQPAREANGPVGGTELTRESRTDGGAENGRPPTSSSRPYFLPHLRKSIMPMDEKPQKRVCFYFNVMPEGCRKAAEECEFAHIYLDGALEARRRAEAQGLLPPVADGCHEQPQHVRREAGDGGGLARHRLEGPSTVPHMPPPLQVPQAPAVWANGNGGGGGGNHGGGGGYPQPSLALAPSYSYHSYMATSERPAEAFPQASQGPVVYDTRPTKIYVQMPRTRTGQRVCYYHNVGHCVNPSCPFLHVLVNMRALRASAMVLSRDGGGGGSNGSDGGGGIPPASPYMRGTVSAPPTAVEATYSYAPEAYYAGAGGGYVSPHYGAPSPLYGQQQPPPPQQQHQAQQGQQGSMPSHSGRLHHQWTT